MREPARDRQQLLAMAQHLGGAGGVLLALPLLPGREHFECGFQQAAGAFAPASRILGARAHRREGWIVAWACQDLVHLPEAPAGLGGKRDAVGKLRRLRIDARALYRQILQRPREAIDGPCPGVALVAHGDRKSTRLNSSHVSESRMPSSA